MPKFAAAQIRMQANFDLLFPASIDFDVMASAKCNSPFCEDVISFLSELSASILKDPQSRLYPDVITFAYFCRKANLRHLKTLYYSDSDVRLGRGVVFHIAPSNVPINFGYSFVASLLAGNKNIVRVSSKTFPQVDFVIWHLNRVCENNKFRKIKESNAIVRYDHASNANEYFSSLAAVRVIWGGDQTISTIRKSELPARSFDVCFADRYSIAVINPGAIIDASDSEMKRLANAFYNDTYLFDQNACSAPHIIFWIYSKKLKNAKTKFWKYVHTLTIEKYNLQPVIAVDKLTAFYAQAIKTEIRRAEMPDNIVVRAELYELPADIDAQRCAGGYFNEFTISDLSEILPIITPKYQTLAYYGINPVNLKEFVLQNLPGGLDRIVPFGQTTEFSLVWDGYNLIDTLSRIVNVI